MCATATRRDVVLPLGRCGPRAVAHGIVIISRLAALGAAARGIWHTRVELAEDEEDDPYLGAYIRR